MSFHICRRTETIQLAVLCSACGACGHKEITVTTLSRVSIYTFVPLFSFFLISSASRFDGAAMCLCVCANARDFCQTPRKSADTASNVLTALSNSLHCCTDTKVTAHSVHKCTPMTADDGQYLWPTRSICIGNAKS